MASRGSNSSGQGSDPITMSQFRVHSITALDHDLIAFVERMKKQEDWRPCLNEIETYLEVDPTCVFVGELDGKPIGCVTFFKYGESFSVFDNFVIEKEYRGKGYGLEMYNTAVRSVQSSHNIAAFATDQMLNKYIEKCGFEFQWSVHTMDLNMSSALQVLSQSPLSSLYSTKTIDEVDPAALYDYDTKVFGYPREAFLHKCLRSPGSHARVAVDGDDNIVGYTAARVAINRDEGYGLGPLYAESSEIAKILLKALFEEMLEKGWSSSPSVWLDCPVGKNAEAKRLMELLDGKVVFNLNYITTNGNPNGVCESCFAVTSCSVG